MMKTLDRSCEVGQTVQYQSTLEKNHGIAPRQVKIVDREECFAFNGVYFVVRDLKDQHESSIFVQ